MQGIYVDTMDIKTASPQSVTCRHNILFLIRINENIIKHNAESYSNTNCKYD